MVITLLADGTPVFANADIVHTSDSARYQGVGDQSNIEYRIGQSFTPTANITVSQVDLEMSETSGSPNTNIITVRIETDASNKPSGTLADPNASASTTVTTVSSSVYTVNSWNFTPFDLNASTKYWIVISVPDQPTNAYWVFNRSTPTYPGGAYILSNTGGSTWGGENQSTDLYFKIYAEASNAAPVITLLGNATETIQVGSTYTDAGATATDNEDGDITVSIVTTGLPVDTNTLGNHTITYNVSDSSGKPSTQVTRTVTVVGTTPPSIALLGNTSIAHPVGTAYTDPGATATDNIDGDITGNITVGGLGFNTSTPGGPFTITYNVSDAAGNAAPQVTRLVSVVDNTPPVISIIGSTTVDVFVGATYTDAGATASDNIDGDITGQIITTGLGFSTSVAGGPFTISYNVTDSAGNPAPTITRTVNVVDPAAFSCLTSGPIQVDETGDFTPVTIGSAFSTGGVEPVTFVNDIPTSPLFSHFPVGDTIVTWTFTDALNRNAVCQQVITVNGTPGGGSGDDRIAITSLPFNIIGPGSYYFPSNLFFTATSGNAITINSSDVTIDFNGYNLIGPGIAVCACHGISMGNYRNVVIRNGTIKSFGGHGICNSATTSSGYRISKIRSHSNGLSGIYLEGSNHLVTQSAVYDNGGVGSGGFGINLPGDGNSVTRSVVSNNNGGGINTGSASTVSHNGVGNNTGTGINTGSASTITHNGVSNNTGTGIIGVSGNTYSNNRVYSNTGSGMIGVSGNNYTNNNVYNNSGSGLTGGSGCSYVSNNIYNNTLSGIIAGLAARVKGNICYSNRHSGITAGNGSKVVDNTVYLNNTINSPSHAGIVATGRAIILSNTLSLNSKQNIHVSGDGNIVEDNTVSDSENGITFASGTNYSSGNKAFGNTNAAFSGSAQSPAADECNANIDFAP